MAAAPFLAQRSLQHARAPACTLRTPSPSAECRCSAGSRQEQATPLLDAVLARGGRLQDTPFHVPGHKVSTGLAS